MNEKERKKLLHKIERLIYSLSSGELSYEDSKKYEGILYETIDSILPRYLYKFRDDSDIQIDNLKNDSLYLNIPANFNDPTENLAFLDQNKLVPTVLDMPPFNCIFDPTDKEDASIGYLLKKTDILNKSLNYITIVRKRTKLVCLSEVIDSTLMWSHYANSHRGFAIRYDINDFEFDNCKNCKDSISKYCFRPKKPVFPVIYTEKRYDATERAIARALYLERNSGIDREDYSIPLLSILQKNKDWEYEKEWRIVCQDTNSKYIECKANAVYLGVNCSKEKSVKLARIAREKGIPLYKMKIDYYSADFKLIYDDWSSLSDEQVEELTLEEDPEFGE